SQPPSGISTSDPIAPFLHDPRVPRTTLDRIARIQNAMVWVEGEKQGEKDGPRHFTLNVRSGGMISQVTYTYIPAARRIERHGPEGVTRVQVPQLVEFSLSPYIEFLVDRQASEPLQLLKCWVEVKIELTEDKKQSPIQKKTVGIHTRIVPKYL